MKKPETFNLVIPMAGKGLRFRKSNYKTFKPFIKIDEKYMLEYVTKNFPKSVKVWIITCEEYLNKKQKNFLKKQNMNVLFIKPHKLGPAYSISKCKRMLPLDESFFISYCDIDWNWNFSEVKKKLNSDGLIFTHKGFHPHKLLNNYSAFCKTKYDKLDLIKEKESFTNNWLDEDLSIGIFYIKNGYTMMSAISELIAKRNKVSNEYFPSLIFNYLVKQDLNIFIYRLDYYIHWGVPSQLHDYVSWKNRIRKIEDFKIKQFSKEEIILCMAGKSSRMNALKKGNKAFMKIFSLPMFIFVSNFFPHTNKTVIITRNLSVEKKKYFTNSDKIIIDKNTNSQVETLKLSKEKIIKKKNFFLLSCDALGIFNMEEFYKEKKNADVIIFSFEPSLIQRIQKNSHTHITVNKDTIQSINIKKIKFKSDKGLAGFFWFSDGKIFNSIEKLKEYSKSEKLVDHFIKLLLKEKYKISVIKLDEYLHLGSVNEFLEFNFWKNHFAKNK